MHNLCVEVFYRIWTMKRGKNENLKTNVIEFVVILSQPKDTAKKELKLIIY